MCRDVFSAMVLVIKRTFLSLDIFFILFVQFSHSLTDVVYKIHTEPASIFFVLDEKYLPYATPF